MVPIEERDDLTTIKELVINDPSISRIYGFILYTNENPYVARVLANTYNWQALDSASGSKWPVFAVKPLIQGHPHISGSGSGMSFLVPTWVEPDANKRVLKSFGLSDSKKLPLFIAFIWDDNDELIKAAIPIRGKSEDEVLKSLTDIIAAITDVIDLTNPVLRETTFLFQDVKAKLQVINGIEIGKSLGPKIIKITGTLYPLIHSIAQVIAK